MNPQTQIPQRHIPRISILILAALATVLLCFSNIHAAKPAIGELTKSLTVLKKELTQLAQELKNIEATQSPTDEPIKKFPILTKEELEKRRQTGVIGKDFGLGRTEGAFPLKKKQFPILTKETKVQIEEEPQFEIGKKIPRKDLFKNVVKTGCYESYYAGRIKTKDKKHHWDPEKTLFTYEPGIFYKYSIKDLDDTLTEEKKTAILKLFNKDKAAFNMIVYDGTPDDNLRRYADIGALQGSNPGAVFQLASNFHCLEGGMNREWYNNRNANLGQNSYTGNHGSCESIIGAHAVQGEEGSLSAEAGLIWRMYGVNQSKANLLKFFDSSIIYGITKTGKPLINIANIPNTQKEVDEKAQSICIGFHEDIEVSTGLSNVKYLAKNGNNRKQNTDDENIKIDKGCFISQALTAAINLKHFQNLSRTDNQKLERLAKSMLKAAYAGTIKAAALHGKRKVFLTMVGTGAFNNKPEWITEALKPLKDFIEDMHMNITLIAYRMEKNDPWVQSIIKKFVKTIGGTVTTAYKDKETGKSMISTELFLK